MPWIAGLRPSLPEFEIEVSGEIAGAPIVPPDAVAQVRAKYLRLKPCSQDKNESTFPKDGKTGILLQPHRSCWRMSHSRRRKQQIFVHTISASP
jgi:hypothetical protein